MRRMVSHGTNHIGYRIYPGSPDDDQQLSEFMAARGVFNEGLDRLNRQRELSAQQHRTLETIAPPQHLAQQLRQLEEHSNRLWQIAMQKQAYLRRETDDPGELSINQIGHQLISLASQWQALKMRLFWSRHSLVFAPEQITMAYRPNR